MPASDAHLIGSHQSHSNRPNQKQNASICSADALSASRKRCKSDCEAAAACDAGTPGRAPPASAGSAEPVARGVPRALLEPLHVGCGHLTHYSLTHYSVAQRRNMFRLYNIVYSHSNIFVVLFAGGGGASESEWCLPPALLSKHTSSTFRRIPRRSQVHRNSFR